MNRHAASTAIALAFWLPICLNAQTTITFDNEMKGWEIVDEPAKNLGEGPSAWSIRKSQLGLSGNVLFQSSNAWGSPADSQLMGTFAVYTAEKFRNFTLEMDVAAQDNDGMGLVWAFTGTDRHYRVIMINDVWPELALDKVRGPFMRMDKRTSDDEPWYAGLTMMKGDYKPYAERVPLHWKLVVNAGKFRFERGDGLVIEGADTAYVEGSIGIQLYAQQAEFDNVKITPALAVDPSGKTTALLGELKSAR